MAMRPRSPGLVTMVTLALLTAGCQREPVTIDTSSLEAFEKSMIAANRSLSEAERTKFQNAIFALVTNEARFHWRSAAGKNPDLDDWVVSSAVFRDEEILHHHPSGQLDVDRNNFVRGLAALAAVKDTDAAVKFAVTLQLDLVDPIAAAVKHVVAAEKMPLQQKAEAAVEVLRREPVGEDIGQNQKNYRMKFSIRNNSKWTIAAIDAKVYDGYVYVREPERLALTPFHFDLQPTLAPGATSQEMTVELTVPSNAVPRIEKIAVYLDDGQSFDAPRPDELPGINRRMAALARAEGPLAAGFKQITDWLRSLH